MLNSQQTSCHMQPIPIQTMQQLIGGTEFYPGDSPNRSIIAFCRVSTKKGLDESNHLKQQIQIRDTAIQIYGISPCSIKTQTYRKGYHASSMAPQEALNLLQALPSNCDFVLTDATRLARTGNYSHAEHKAIITALEDCSKRGIRFILHTIKNKDVTINSLRFHWWIVTPKLLVKLMDGYDPAMMNEKLENFKLANAASIKVRTKKKGDDIKKFSIWYNKWHGKKGWKVKLKMKLSTGDTPISESTYQRRLQESKSNGLIT